jgi:hypothetical protein
MQTAPSLSHHVSIVISHWSSHGKIININIPTIRCKAPDQLLSSAHSNVHFFTSQRFTLPEMYLYQKDEWAMAGNLQNSKICVLPLL